MEQAVAAGRGRRRPESGLPGGRGFRLGLLLVVVLLGLGLTEARAWAKTRPARGKAAAAAVSLSERPSDYEPVPAGEAGGPDYVALAQKVEAAYRATPAPELLYELGVLAHLLGRRVEAHDLLRRFLADPLSGPGVRGFSEAELVLALPRPPTGEVQVVADDEGLLVVDGRLLGSLPLSLPLLLPVGRHQLRLEMQDKTMKAEVDVLDGRAVELRFNRASGAVVVTLPPAAILLLRGNPAVLPADLFRRLQETTAKALQKARLALYDRQAALRRAPTLADCLSSLPCQAQLALKSDVEYLLTLSLPIVASDDLQLRLGLVDAETAAEAAAFEVRCPRCTAETLLSRLAEGLQRLLKDGAGRARGVLIVRSNPAGAEVRLGDEVVGQTPYEHAALAGPLTVRLQRPAFAAVSREVLVPEGKSVTLEVELTPIAPPAPAPEAPIVAAAPAVSEEAARRPRWRLAVGGVALGLGLGLVGLGVSGVAIDGECVVPPQPPMLNCRDRFDTLSKGAALIGVGAGLSLAGVVLMAWPPRKPSAGRRPSP